MKPTEPRQGGEYHKRFLVPSNAGFALTLG